MINKILKKGDDKKIANLNLNSRQISRDNVKLNLTEREGNLIIFLRKSLFVVIVSIYSMKERYRGIDLK